MKLATALLATVALSTATVATAQPQPPMGGPALPTNAFIRVAAQTDEFERQEGQLASMRAINPQVRSFGRMMVMDHTKTTLGLKSAIRRDHMPVPPPPPLSGDQQRMIGQLKLLHGRDFDRTYIAQQVQVHQDALGVMQAYAGGGRGDAPIRAAAMKTVPIVQHHLAMAQGLQGRL